MITQFEADLLIAMSKKRGSDQNFDFPRAGEILVTIYPSEVEDNYSPQSTLRTQRIYKIFKFLFLCALCDLCG